ncbi:S8 family serine peptidase [Streptomyces sp. H27-G5]|uniref:S8 family serine peptidase n=1 Tax=Streptomyces sp. H27-G5 TaxID=2996698 RepID=UPI002271F809|nr:S8 family serine peptidase [Streptomyces sp. H27-G5]MCY0924278.1 S8 family serine peptidase [Streptomyces sp. H27-G5]
MSNEHDGVTTTSAPGRENTVNTQTQPPHAREASRAAAQARSNRSSTELVIPEHWSRYLVAPRPQGWLHGTAPLVGSQDLFTFLDEDSDALVLDRITAPSTRTISGDRLSSSIAVVAMPASRACALASNPQIIVEHDQPLLHAGIAGHTALTIADPSMAPLLDASAEVDVRVLGANAVPVVAAHVWAVGIHGVTHAVTDREGRARLKLAADAPTTIRTLHIRPVKGYWPLRLEWPFLTGEANATFTLLPLSNTIRDFPDEPMTGWGVRAMRLDRLPTDRRGEKIRIALLDGGINASHPDLKDTVTHGLDLTTETESDTWDMDATGRGTWCAGVIAAADNGTGVMGIAPEAQLHSLKLFPGGRMSDLLRALDHCVAERIDIAQINVSYTEASRLMECKILEATAAGVVTIAPCGDNPTTLSHVATLPSVLAVGALSRSVAGIHPAPYSPYRPGIDLYAPGSSIVTTGHLGDYCAADGTALAAAHITALTAMLLAHHQPLRSHITPLTRTQHLHHILQSATLPRDLYHEGTPRLPDAPTALNIHIPVP